MRTAIGYALLGLLAVLPSRAPAEDGHRAWLRYAPITDPQQYGYLPSHIVLIGETPSDKAAARELQQGLSAMLGRAFRVTSASHLTSEDHQEVILLGSAKTLSRLDPVDYADRVISGEQYRIALTRSGQHSHLLILGGTPQSELFAAFHLLEEVAAQRAIPVDERQAPSSPIRWTDEWDNFDGTIERGYAGPSIFFENGHIRQELSRAGEYARLLASVGLNGCNINNVNANLNTLSTEHLQEFARVAEVFRPWGIHLSLSIDLTSPQVVGKLSTFDPLDPAVVAWWKTKVDEIYTLIPDFAGFTVKADSEGRKGPSLYGRSPADAANVLARALAPHRGVVLYRGFVYNNHLDWKDLKADRARAGVDNFARYDGSFEPNVIIQIKEGPIDFQTREPVSPLLAALPHTSVAIEVQSSQEYTGQQRHMVWLPPMWKDVLNTDMRAGERSAPGSRHRDRQEFPPA